MRFEFITVRRRVERGMYYHDCNQAESGVGEGVRITPRCLRD